MYKENKEAVYQIIDTFHIHSPFKVYKNIHLVGYSWGFLYYSSPDLTHHAVSSVRRSSLL